MNNTALTPHNLLFSKGGASTVSEPFYVGSEPQLVIAFGLSATTSIKLQMLDIVSQASSVVVDNCTIGCGENYPDKDVLVSVDAQDVCGFKLCKANYIGRVLIEGWYRAVMSDSTSLVTAKVWRQAASIEVALNIPSCPTCP